MSDFRVKKEVIGVRVAIAASDKTLESPVDFRFGRCPYFLIFNTEEEGFEALGNEAGQAFHGAGVSAAQMMVDKGIKAVIAGNFGPNAVQVLTNSGIKIFGGVSGMSVKEAWEQYQTDKLKETTAATTPSGRGMGRGMGRRGRQ